MSFTQQLQQFAAKAEKQRTAVFIGAVIELRDSIKFGSALTGAPAMPVAPGEFANAGELRDSVMVSYPDENTAIISTTTPYAPDVEFNAKGHQFHTGGPHGWALSAAAFPRVVDMVAKRQSGNDR